MYPVCPFSFPIEYQGKIDFSAEMMKLAIPFDKIFSNCGWSGVYFTCATVFSKLLTDDGLCYTFNMMNKDLYNENSDESMKYPKHNDSSANWTLQDGYKSYAFKAFPMRILGSGLQAGLKIQLTGNKTDFEYRCSGYAKED